MFYDNLIVKKGILGIVLFVWATSLLQAETKLKGYHYNKKADGIRANKAYPLVLEFKGLVDPNLDKAPSARETEIYETLLRNGTGRAPAFIDDRKKLWDFGGRIGGSVKNLKRSKNLVFLERAIFFADNLVYFINDTDSGLIAETTGKREPVWPSAHKKDFDDGVMKRIPHLATGAVGTPLGELTVFILENPQLHNQEAPVFFADKGLGRNVVGKTYLDRARFYLKKLNGVCDFFVREGSYWEFDTGNPDDILGWWFNNTKKALEGLNEQRKAEPTIDSAPENFVKKSKQYGWGPRPVNRALILNSMFAKTAQGLRLIDKIEKKKRYAKTAALYDRVIRNCNNCWRRYSIEVDEGGLKGISRYYQYAYAKLDRFMNKGEWWYIEDTTHFTMDMGAVKVFEQADRECSDKTTPYMTDRDYKALAGTCFSRVFSYEANVTYVKVYADKIRPGQKWIYLGRELDIDKKTSLPRGYGDYMCNHQGPIGAEWIVRYGTREQQMAFLAKSLETYDERMRRLNADKNDRNFTLQRVDTWPHYRLVYPFQIYELKKGLQEQKPSNANANESAPVIEATAPITIATATPLHTKIGQIKAHDADVGQNIYFWIIGGNQGYRFQLDYKTGELATSTFYPVKSAPAKEYKLDILVIDNGYPMKTAQQSVTINIKDAPKLEIAAVTANTSTDSNSSSNKAQGTTSRKLTPANPQPVAQESTTQVGSSTAQNKKMLWIIFGLLAAGIVFVIILQGKKK